MKALGFIGTGGMGGGMAANLIKAGYSLVVNDLRREQARGLESQGQRSRSRPERLPSPVRWCFRCCRTMKRFERWDWVVADCTEAASGAKLWVDFSSIDKKTIVGVNAELEKRVDCSRRLCRRCRRSSSGGNAVALDLGIERTV